MRRKPRPLKVSKDRGERLTGVPMNTGAVPGSVESTSRKGDIKMQFVAVLSAIGVGYFIAFGLLMLHV